MERDPLLRSEAVGDRKLQEGRDVCVGLHGSGCFFMLESEMKDIGSDGLGYDDPLELDGSKSVGGAARSGFILARW